MRELLEKARYTRAPARKFSNIARRIDVLYCPGSHYLERGQKCINQKSWNFGTFWYYLKAKTSIKQSFKPVLR